MYYFTEIYDKPGSWFGPCQWFGYLRLYVKLKYWPSKMSEDRPRLFECSPEVEMVLTSRLASLCCCILTMNLSEFPLFKDKNFSIRSWASGLKHPAHDVGKLQIMSQAFGY